MNKNAPAAALKFIGTDYHGYYHWIPPWTGGVCGYFVLCSMASRTSSSLLKSLKSDEGPDDWEYFPNHQNTRRQHLIIIKYITLKRGSGSPDL